MPAWSPDEDTELAEAAARHPGWDFHRVYAGVIAVPKGALFAHAFEVPRLEEKVAEIEAGNGTVAP